MAEDQEMVERVSRKRRHDFANRYTFLHTILAIITAWFGESLFGMSSGIVDTTVVALILLAGGAQSAYLGGSVVDYVSTVVKRKQ